MMKEGRKLHVHRHKTGWAIFAEGNKRPTRVTKKFHDAFIIAWGLSSERNAGVEIHDTNGRLNPDRFLYSLTVSENGGNQKIYDFSRFQLTSLK